MRTRCAPSSNTCSFRMPSVVDRRAAVFLDRDGTLNEEVEYLHRPEDFRWIRGAPESIQALNRAGLLVIVITNQAGVAHGRYDEAAVAHLHESMQADLAHRGARIDAFYTCFTHPDARIEKYRRDDPCRKPGKGMFLHAIDDWSVDAGRSFMVGDKNTDIVPARELGMRTILVRTGYGASMESTTVADLVESDIAAAVKHILEQSTTTR